MNCLFTLFFFVFWLSATAQFKIVSDSEFEIETPKDVRSYSIYCHSTSAGWQNAYKGKRILIKKVVAEKGREKQIIEMEGDKLLSIQNNYFKNDLLQKAVVRYGNPKSVEIFYYNYNSSSENPIAVKGYKDGKLIYNESSKYINDTLEVQKVYNLKLLKARERTLTYYSVDSLTRKTVEFLDHQSKPKYSTIRYNLMHKIVEEVDSSDEGYRRKTYLYDSLYRLTNKIYFGGYENKESRIIFFTYDSVGRLKEEKHSTSGTETLLIEYGYAIRETTRTEYNVSAFGQKDTARLTTKRFDITGNLIFEEELTYDQNVLIGENPKVINISLQYWTYDKGRIVKYVRRDYDDGPIITYDVIYEE